MENKLETITKMKGDSYATPSWLKDLFEGWFDPCTISKGEFREFDGLGSSWGGDKARVYVNPPYSKPLPWVKKAISEMKKGKLIVMLLRADTSTEYFQLCLEHGEVLFFSRRIKFNGKSPNFASALVIFNGREQ